MLVQVWPGLVKKIESQSSEVNANVKIIRHENILRKIAER